MFGIVKPKIRKAMVDFSHGAKKAGNLSVRADKAMNDFGSVIDGKKFDSFIMGGKVELPRRRLNEYDQRVRTMKTGV